MARAISRAKRAKRARVRQVPEPRLWPCGRTISPPPLVIFNSTVHTQKSQRTRHAQPAQPKMAPKAKTGPAAAPNDQRPAKQSGAKNAYLLAYNAVSAALWAGVLYQTVIIGGYEIMNAHKASVIFGKGDWFTAIQRGLASGKVYDNLEHYTRAVQTLAGLEVLHSLVGRFSRPSPIGGA